MKKAIIFLICYIVSNHSFAQYEASYHPETQEVFIPKVKVIGDTSDTAYSVTMQQNKNPFKLSITSINITQAGTNVQIGTRPYFLLENMDEGELKSKLQQCSEGPFRKSEFSIGHRGAPLQYPEHTIESYTAAARMGAGILECDVTFTKDQQLVCRHSQCDLHTTTDVLNRPELAAKCSVPFDQANPRATKCCTSDFTLAEIKSLCGKMDAADTNATTVEDYMDATPNWRTDLYSSCGTIMSHAESIELFKKLGVKMTPELKTPSVEMPYNGSYTQQKYAQQMINEYKAAGVPAKDVFVQSFNYSDILYWLKNEPEFGSQAIYLDGRAYGETEEDKSLFPNFDPNDSNTWEPRNMKTLIEDGVNFVAPPIWVLVTKGEYSKIIPSEYAKQAKDNDLNIITWTLERSGPLNSGGGWYYQTINEAINNDGDMITLLDVLTQEVGISGIFSDWPATVTYYANCMGL